MKSYNYNSVVQKVENLISLSVLEQNRLNPAFKLMHRIIIKKYFDAKNVQINYDEDSVTMKLPVGKNKFTQISVECQNLERFLKSCLKNDDTSIYFYENILTQYQRRSKEVIAA